MEVNAVLSNGGSKALHIEMSCDWFITSHFGDRPVQLSVQCVLPSISTGLIYLFANSEMSAESRPACPLPWAASELLLFEPVVALVKCAEGFQALSWNAWKELTTSTCLQDFGMPSSMTTSLNVMGEDEVDLQSLESASCHSEESSGSEEVEDLSLSDVDSQDVESDASM
jgi:hypothetical protein